MEKGKKSVNKKGGNPKEKPVENNHKELYWIFGVMGFLLVILLISSSVIGSLKKFEYHGLAFTKEKFGELDVYHYYYNFNEGNQTYVYNLYLRNDPRTNNVPMDEGKTYYPKEDTIYISVNGTDLSQCPQSSLGVSSIASFLANNFLKVKGAVPDKDLADKNNLTYASCKSNPNNVVILIQAGNETKITQNGNCQMITVNNCEILPAAEKYEVQSIIDAKNRNTQ